MQGYIVLPDNYTATLIGSDGRTSRIFRSIDKVRSEVYPHFSFEEKIDYSIIPQQVIIGRKDLGIMFIWDTKLFGKKFKKMKLSKEFYFVDTSIEYKWELSGKEKIREVNCDKYELMKPETKLVSEVIYVDPKTNMRHRVVSFDKLGNIGITIDSVDIHIGVPDQKLFECE